MKGNRFFTFGRSRKGFTLVELLVVVAILGVLAAVAIPNVGKFINKGKTEAKNTELHNIQTGVMALLADSTAGVLDDDYVNISDLNDVTADGNADLNLAEYVVGINSDGTVRTGVQYDITADGRVSQHAPVAP